jgi:hypothetical protein
VTTIAFSLKGLGLHLSPTHVHGFVAAIISVCGALTVGFLLHAIAFRLLGRFRHKKDVLVSPVLHSIATRLRRPALAITMIATFFVAFLIATPFFGFSAGTVSTINKSFWVALFIAVKAGVKVGQRGGAKVGQWMAMQLLSISWGRASGA